MEKLWPARYRSASWLGTISYTDTRDHTFSSYKLVCTVTSSFVNQMSFVRLEVRRVVKRDIT